MRVTLPNWLQDPADPLSQLHHRQTQLFVQRSHSRQLQLTPLPPARPSRKLAHKYYQQRLHELIQVLKQSHESEAYVPSSPPSPPAHHRLHRHHLHDLSEIRSGAWDERLVDALPTGLALTPASPPPAEPTSPVVVPPKSPAKTGGRKGRKGKGASEVPSEVEEVPASEDVEMAEVEPASELVEVPEVVVEEEAEAIVEPAVEEPVAEEKMEEVVVEPEAEEEEVKEEEADAESEGLTELEQSPAPTPAPTKKSVFRAGGAGGGGTIGGVKKGGRKSARGKAAEEEVEVPAEEDAGTEDGQEEAEVEEEEKEEEEQEEGTKTRDRKGKRKAATKGESLPFWACAWFREQQLMRRAFPLAVTKRNHKRKASEPVDAGSPPDIKNKKRLKTEELSEDPALSGSFPPPLLPLLSNPLLSDKAQKNASAQFKRAVGTVIDGLSNEPSAHHFKSRVPKSLAAAYDEIVHRPMHIAELKANVKNGKVSTPKEVMRDVALMLANAQQYNGPDTEVGEAAQQLWTVFEECVPFPLLSCDARADCFARAQVDEATFDGVDRVDAVIGGSCWELYG